MRTFVLARSGGGARWEPPSAAALGVLTCVKGALNGNGWTSRTTVTPGTPEPVSLPLIVAALPYAMRLGWTASVNAVRLIVALAVVNDLIEPLTVPAALFAVTR